MQANAQQAIRKRIGTFVTVLPVIFVLILGGCKSNPASAEDDNDNGNDTPRTSVPAQLVGTWYTGTVSSVNFYNPNTGAWGAPSGTGLFYKFTAEGYYEKGMLMQTTLYNCTSTVHAYNRGTVTVAGDRIVLYPTYGRIKSVDNCVEEFNYEKADELKTETIIWQVGRDEYDVETMWARYPDSDFSAFHRP
ncbi:hypothetical protein HUU05_10970 [candidate division KSB1 bacterium]|nr:hypothetical protein [candidate division KSB1 bacterium]